MTARVFRRLALALTDAVEGSHMGHPDFRVNGRVFASLTGDESRGMVVLTSDQQATCVGDHPSVFEPETGAWGRAGCTRVRLQSADEEVVGEVLTLAWRNGVAKRTARAKPRKRR